MSKHPRRALWHGQAFMPEVERRRVVIASGDGAYVTTASGQRLLDLPASLWCVNVGHGRQTIADAVRDQMVRVASYSNFQRFATAPALELAERVVALAPVADGVVFFGSGGSDAVDTACKLARRYWSVRGRPDKQGLVSRTNGYHGLHGFGTSISGLPVHRAGFGELMPQTHRVPHDDWRAFEGLVADVGADRIAAFVCEPVVGSGGLYPPEPGYFEQIQRICRSNDILLIVDEVITGFGRTGALFASERLGIEPDMLLFAKGVTSGYMPLGGVVVSGAVSEPFWDPDAANTFRHGLTYQAHAAACAGALANLDILEGERLPERVRGLERTLEQALHGLDGQPGVVEVRAGFGLLGAVQVRDAALAGAAVDGLMERGVLTRVIGDGTAIQFSPPFVIEEAEIEQAVAKLAEVLAVVGDPAIS